VREVPLGASYLPVPGEDQAEVRLVRSWGSCGIDYPKLLSGEVDFLCYRSMFPWDHLAGGLMVAELGGRIATDTGLDYAAGVIGRRLVSATDPRLWLVARDALFGD
jgi:fructose-1,6-bisphosphatase/inositol monophosphatase family enzyme